MTGSEPGLVRLITRGQGPRAGPASRLRMALCLGLACWGGHNGLAADTNAVLNAWFAAQAKLQTWAADFTQTRTLKTLTQPLASTGRIWFASPDRFRWELGSPAQTVAVRNANELLVIYPRLQRAEKYAVGGGVSGEWRDLLSLLDAGCPRDRADFDARFRVLSLTESDGAWRLGLQPRSAFARRMIREIRLDLAAHDFSLVSNELIFADDSRMRNDYTNAVRNSVCDEKLFDPKPGPEFVVAEPMKK